MGLSDLFLLNGDYFLLASIIDFFYDFRYHALPPIYSILAIILAHINTVS